MLAVMLPVSEPVLLAVTDTEAVDVDEPVCDVVGLPVPVSEAVLVCVDELEMEAVADDVELAVSAALALTLPVDVSDAVDDAVAEMVALVEADADSVLVADAVAE